jgi:hypothetical protein
MHYQTVGFECARCHNTKSWIVENITEVHHLSRFPLLGAHFTADCFQCHPSASLLRFEPLGIECFDCHMDEYLTAKNPDHVAGNFSTNCNDCHDIHAFEWSGTGFNHAFFPLTGGHALNDCKQCHTGDDYSNISSACMSCHMDDYNASTNPNHFSADISTECMECHTTSPGWKPAEFQQHDGQYFPIYAGSHSGTWISCADCHANPGNYAVYSCIDCHDHNQPEMNDSHEGVGGYQYESIACFECHPTGEEEGSFNHNLSNFPLTGAHLSTDCAECHLNGYAGTPTVCFECHMPAFNLSTNPNHLELGLSNDCSLCHSTAPEWKPATFDNHSEYYMLTGAHASIANNCFDCHKGNYINTPNQCFSCHETAYQQSVNPNHVAIGIGTDCETCHTTNPDWTPALFPTHDQYYPLNGAHASIANDCLTCHQNNYTNTPNTCYGCHSEDYNQTTNPNHLAAQFPIECEACHNEIAWVPATFDHDEQYFPIYSGSHEGEWNLCSDCHTNPGNYAVFDCLSCHEQGEMDDKHDEVPGYVYNSIACLECHPDGDAKSKFFKMIR